MRKLLTFLLAVLLHVSGIPSARSEGLSDEALGRLEKTHPFFIILERNEEGFVRYLYTDRSGHLHVYSVQEGKSVLEWETERMGTGVSSLFVTDVNADGRDEILVSTVGGRIIAFDAMNYDKLGENLLEPFKNVKCMVAANLDNDEQQEIIFVADGYLYIYDGLTRVREWQSQDEYQATELLVANIDDDEQLEIILNSGAIIDSRFYREELNYDLGFGSRMRLVDLNGDGYLEIIGDVGNYSLRVFDLYAEREIW